MAAHAIEQDKVDASLGDNVTVTMVLSLSTDHHCSLLLSPLSIYI